VDVAPTRWLGRISGLFLAGLVLLGCGSSSQRSTTAASAAQSASATVRSTSATVHSNSTAVQPPVCRPGLVVLGRVRSFPYTGNNGDPDCRLQGPGGLDADVNLDPYAQPDYRLSHEIAADRQHFGKTRGFSPPELVAHLGLGAAWVPAIDRLITANHHEFITIIVEWPGTSSAARKALAIKLAQAYVAAR
jgi:hypothetical protein